MKKEGEKEQKMSPATLRTYAAKEPHMGVEAATKSVKTRRNSLLRKGIYLQMAGRDAECG